MKEDIERAIKCLRMYGKDTNGFPSSEVLKVGALKQSIDKLIEEFIIVYDKLDELEKRNVIELPYEEIKLYEEACDECYCDIVGRNDVETTVKLKGKFVITDYSRFSEGLRRLCDSYRV